MFSTLRCRYFRKSILWCVPIGGLAGLIGLGGGEFRLPVLMHSIGFAAKTAIPINLAVSAVALAFAFATRSNFVPVGDVLTHGPEIVGLSFGGMITASFGPPLVQKLTSLWLIRIIAFLLAAIGVLLWVEVFWASAQIEVKPDALARFLLACVLGGVVGLVSSVLGVAGGELLIPILIFFFGASIVVAGSASALISLSIIGVGLYRHWQLGTFPRGKGIHRIVGAMGIGSIFGAFLGSLAIALVSATALKLLLGAVLVAAAAKTLLSVPHIDRI